MALYHYYLLTSKSNNPEISDEEYDTYGIALRGNSQIHIEDISTKRDFVIDLVHLCNKVQLSPEHLFEVVQDRIAYLDDKEI